jgi:TIGR03009 family protein
MAPQGAAPPNAGPPQPPPPPFILTPAEQAQVDRLLLFWEKSSKNIKTFRCKFTRWEYDPVFGPPDKPTYIDEGELRYAAPDKGLYSVEGPRAEKWICDGKSIFEYDFRKKQVIEHRLPPELQGKAIVNGPVPFLFGAKAEQLNRRYWMRIITPPGTQGQVWLEARPRFREDAQNFKYVELILTVREESVQPSAVQIYHPNGKNHTSYLLEAPVVNKPDLRGVFEDPFHARVPIGWQKLVEDAPQGPNPAQRPGAGNAPAAIGDRRTGGPR